MFSAYLFGITQGPLEAEEINYAILRNTWKYLRSWLHFDFIPQEFGSARHFHSIYFWTFIYFHVYNRMYMCMRRFSCWLVWIAHTSTSRTGRWGCLLLYSSHFTGRKRVMWEDRNCPVPIWPCGFLAPTGCPNVWVESSETKLLSKTLHYSESIRC